MTDLKLSLAIPYKQRIDNLRIVFDGIADQSMDRSEFEVIVAAMEYTDEYVALCREYAGRFDLVSVLSTREFTIPRARNLATRQASGQVIVHMDADTLLPAGALEGLYDRYYAFGQNACVVGQVVGYGNNDASVESVEVLPYERYKGALSRLVASAGSPADPRFQADHVLPWAFAWTGLIALPAAAVREHGLFFDEGFDGWGVDDLEWGYRVCASGLPILLRADVCAIHLPHTRDMFENQRSERRNYRRFLRKWPGPDVELAHTFGDVEANRLFLDFERELKVVGDGHAIGTVRATVDGRDVVFVGAQLDGEGRLADRGLESELDRCSRVETLPLVGMALPYDDKSVAECRVLPAAASLSPSYAEAVRAEAGRVARKVVLPGQLGAGSERVASEGGM